MARPKLSDRAGRASLAVEPSGGARDPILLSSRERRGFLRSARQMHCYIGLGAALLVVVLTVSGILLNHPGLLGARSDRTLSLAVDPLDSYHLLRGTRSGLYASYDGGADWEEVPTLFAAEGAVDIVFVPGNPDHVYVVLEDMGLIRSLDGGIVWDQVPLGFVPFVEGVRLLRMGIGSDERLSLWTSGGLMTSGDAGKTWQPVGQPRSPGRDLYILVHQLHTGYLFSSWFYYLYDAAAGALIAITLSGVLIWRRRVGRTAPPRRSVEGNGEAHDVGKCDRRNEEPRDVQDA